MLRITASIGVLLAAALVFWQWPALTGTPNQITALAAPANTDSADQRGISKTKIQLMTSLPLIWGDNASMDNILSGRAAPSPVWEYWKSKYDIKAADSFEGLPTSGTDLIILAQPPAMDPADLAAIDAWVRGGGRILILTDPLLLWPSGRPFGDARRPLAIGLLSPLLRHWGLELLAPEDGKAGAVQMGFADYQLESAGVGSFEVIGTDDADVDADGEPCKLGAAAIIARCPIGKGKAIIVADADFLHPSLWEGTSGNDGEAPDASVAGGETPALKWVDDMIDELVN